ncbi:McrB family protein [Demequina sp. NBRC 110051]|uniref:McrB family protein n=1 Tax=Demequina sp. NBRC 110051 TaxID=1570340 RepID=UPI0013563BD1|nr:AAA family ATPase [Demequina sp. NBRC 110051]
MAETTAGSPHRKYWPIEGTERIFDGVEYELGESPSGYVYKRDSHLMHATDCFHAPALRLEPRSRDEVIRAWRESPEHPVDPRWCQNCILLPVPLESKARPNQEAARTRAVSEAASVVLIHAFGDRRSAIDPNVEIWTPAYAERLRSAIEDFYDDGPGTFLQKLESQLAHEPREVKLLAAEMIYLRGVPLVNLTPRKKREHIETVLSWLPDAPALPGEIEAGVSTGGTFNGGQGYSQQMWKQVVWLSRFVVRWGTLPENERAAALDDPWAFRAMVVDDERDLPSMRHAFLSMVFPWTFESIVNDKHKKGIRDTFQLVIGGATGDSGEAIDRDILAIRTALEKRDGIDRLDWYTEPWESQWRDDLSGTTRAWAVRTKPAGRELIDQWLGEGFVSLAAAHLSEIESGASRSDVRERVNADFDHVDYTQRMYLTDDFFAFLSRMEAGDIVVTRHEREAWVGTISGEVAYSDAAPRLRRSVTWHTDALVFDDLPAGVRKLFAGSRSVLDLTDGREVLEQVLGTNRAAVEGPRTQVAHLRPVAEEFARSMHLPHGWLTRFAEILGARRQVIVHGPPGTGKTFVARELAAHIAGDENVRLVQFHPSYGYEDFFEGFRPRKQDDGSLAFDLVPGPLRRISADAAGDPATPYVLIIDEINRANIAKVFGELYFLLEYRGERVELQYSVDEPFALPENLYIIGTMNTADRSIAMVDAAIRRRFSFIEMHPSEEPVASVLENWLKAQGLSTDRARLLAALNAEMGDENRDFQIGPSYLMRDEADMADGLDRVWAHDILPLLEEHFYGRFSREEVASRFGVRALRVRIDAVLQRDDSE